VLPPDPYAGLAVHLLVCTALGVGLILAAKVLRHRVAASRAAKHDTYECGEEPIGEAWRPVSVGFYLIALVFILFDAEAAFLFPWVQSLREAGAPAFWGMVVFLAVLFLGWVYAWRKGDLTWSR
jgi:NADH:ubiquinone oxidoreductase subunit 3 (subunit A)